jgi:hypothetical protein
VKPHEALVGYHGSFWADAETLDLVRLEVYADDIPPLLQLQSASDVMEYGRVPIGGADFLLPRQAELVMVDLAGNESHNRTRFSGCRQYTGESVLSFGDTAATVAPPAHPIEEIQLPSGLIVEARLDTAIDRERTAIGDPVTAIVDRNVKQAGKIVIPKGAVLAGRVVRLEKLAGGPYSYYRIGLDFSTVHFGNGQADFHGHLESVDALAYSSFRVSLTPPAELRSAPEASDPGSFYLKGSRLSLPRGLRLVWRTEFPRSQ